MHTRKARMAELSDGFIAMPGGIGTFEELFEIWTWGQLGIHSKPLGLLNVAGFYDPLATFLDGTVDAGFLKQTHRAMAMTDTEPATPARSHGAVRPGADDQMGREGRDLNLRRLPSGL